MRNITIRSTAVAAMLALAAVLVAGCSNDTVTSPDVGDQTSGAPELPALSTMKAEFDFFGVTPPALDERSIESGKPSDALLQYAAAASRTHWINAFVRVVFVQLLMYDALEEPIGAFALAVHSVPQPRSDGSYLWTYIFVDSDGTEYGIFLFGTPLSDRVVWRMEVSSNSPAMPLDHFVWFDGETMNDDSGGFWQFYDPVTATTGTETHRIDWTHGPTEGVVTITANGVGHPDEGDYLEIRNSGLTASLEHYDASADELSRIEANADGSGSITVPDYNNGQRACWDTSQIDTVCQ